jgi:hypothetical protein
MRASKPRTVISAANPTAGSTPLHRSRPDATMIALPVSRESTTTSAAVR